MAFWIGLVSVLGLGLILAVGLMGGTDGNEDC